MKANSYVSGSLEPVSQGVSHLYLCLIYHFAKFNGECWVDVARSLESRCATGVRFGSQVPLPEINRILSLIASKPGGLSFGLAIGRDVHPSDYGVIGYALMNFPTLGDALKFAAQHKHAMSQGLDAGFVCTGEYCRFQIKNNLESDYLPALVELDLAAAHALAVFLVGRRLEQKVKLIQVNFQHQPLADEAVYREVFSCPVAFGKPVNEIVIAQSVLDLPVRSSDPRLLALYLRKLKRLQQSRALSMSTHQHVVSYLAKNLGKDLPGLPDVSRHFNMSVSTLKNRLKQEGYTYSAIIEQVRKNETLKLMAKDGMQLKEIALTLGFSNQAAFSRAFKRWFAQSPAEYRRAKE